VEGLWQSTGTNAGLEIAWSCHSCAGAFVCEKWTNETERDNVRKIAHFGEG